MRSVSPVPGFAEPKNVKKSAITLESGSRLAEASYLLTSAHGSKLDDENVFGVQASATACAEIHVSKVLYTPGDEVLLDAQIRSFRFDPDYVPSNQDYFTMAAVLFRIMKDFAGAAVYYQRTLDTLSPETPLNMRRLVVDQLSMSYGISGDLKRSRAVNEAAIQVDPNYPLYYYNLACADAEQGKAAEAKAHLQQAFDRKANTLQGEHLPDPTQDDSIQKLRKNKEFWSWVQTLQ